NEQLPCGREHGAGEGRRRGSVLARITIGAQLARILDRTTARAGGEPIDLQDAHAVLAADGSAGRIVAAESLHALRAADTEPAIAFRIARAFVDRIHVVPDAQHRRTGVCGLEGAEPAIGFLGRRRNAAGAFFHLDGAVEIVAVRRIANRAAAT